MNRIALGILGFLFAGTAAALAAEPKGAIRWENTGPAPGVYFYWYEPSFYTGFAPRIQDPKRIHLRLGRGNQFRVTVPLGPDQLAIYAEDLRLQRQMFEQLIQSKVIQATTNVELDKFIAKLDELGVEGIVQSKASMTPEQWTTKNLHLLQALNPGRVFHVRMELRKILLALKEQLIVNPGILTGDTDAQLDLVNNLLPNRLNLTKLDPAMEASLARLQDLAKAADREPELHLESFLTEAKGLYDLASRGLYPVKDGFIDTWEFTALYPAGTEQDFFEWKGKKIPDFGITGVLPLMRRDKGRGATGMVDYLSTNPAYGFMPMFSYQHAGGIVYNSIHNAGVRCPLGGTSFFPKEWNKAPGTRDKTKNYQTLWVISRGPVSHGCTRLASGHLSELRHILPSDSAAIDGLPYFRNLPFTYDVFDINADGTPEVMGIKYYLAYSTTKDRLPHKAWAKNTREPFYEWLYTGELKYAPDGSGYFDEVISCRFDGRRAESGQIYKNIKLYEAEFEPERIQFYKLMPALFDTARGFEFNRELRRVAVGYAPSLKTLFLSDKSDKPVAKKAAAKGNAAKAAPASKSNAPKAAPARKAAAQP